MIKVNVILSSKAWKKNLKDPSFFVKKKIDLINNKYKKFKKTNLTFTLLLSGGKEIKKLNKKFRKKNKTTDILSFPFYEKKELSKLMLKRKDIYLGDVIINYDKIKNKKKNSKFVEEFNKIWVHGLVHLFGHKHKKDRDFEIMNKIEKNYLKLF